MNWKNLFGRLRISKQNIHQRFDKKLVASVRAKFWPSWSQIKYVGRFLNSTEQKIIKISLAVSALALTGLIITLGVAHLEYAPKDGGDYIEAVVGQPKYINPLFATVNDADADLSSLIYSGLFRHDSNQALMPDLASNYKLSDDRKIYTVTIRSDIKWSDGEPLTVNDVIYTFEQIQNPEVGSPLLAGFQGVEIKKLDEFSIQFILKEPFAPFLSSLTVGILPEHIWAEIPAAGLKLAKTNLQPIGTGAWEFQKMVKDDSGNIAQYTLGRNPNFYSKKPYLNTITFKYFNDYTGALEALRGQSADAISFVPADLKNKTSGKNLIGYNLRLPQYTALFFNPNQKKELKTDDLRRALSQSLDKQNIIKTVLSNDGQKIDGPILPGMLGFYASATTTPIANPTEISATLDKTWKRIQPEAFFEARTASLLKNRQSEIDSLRKTSTTPEIVSTTIAQIIAEIKNSVRQEMTANQPYYRQDKDGNILTLTITTADTPEYKKVADLVAQTWAAIGIKTDVKTVLPRQITREAIRERSYEVLLYGEIVGSDPDLYAFWHSSQSNYPGLNLAMFSSRVADKILEDARASADIPARSKLYAQFQQIVTQEIPAIFLYTPFHTFTVNKRVRGITDQFIFSPSDRYNNIGNWYIKTRWIWK